VNDKAAEDCLSINGTYVLLKNECPVSASPAGAKIVRKFSEKGNRLNDRASHFATSTEREIVYIARQVCPPGLCAGAA